MRANYACAYRPSTMSPSPEWARSICRRRLSNILSLGRFEVEAMVTSRRMDRRMGGRWEQQIFFTAATRRLQNTDVECALYVYPGCYRSHAVHAPAHSHKDPARPRPFARQLTLFKPVKHHGLPRSAWSVHAQLANLWQRGNSLAARHSQCSTQNIGE